MKKRGNEELRSALASTTKTPRKFLSIIRPAKLLFLSPIVLECSLYVALGYGYLYLVFSTITMVFIDQYSIRNHIGLVFLGIGIDQFVSLIIFRNTSDKLLNKLAKGAEMNPEYRLPLLWPGAVLAPLGLLIYG